VEKDEGWLRTVMILDAASMSPYLQRKKTAKVTGLW